MIFVPVLSAQRPCQSLADLKLAHTAITSAVLVAEGPVSASGGSGNLPSVIVPARCIVKGVTRPTSDSEINFEVWLPAAGWNGKYTREPATPMMPRGSLAKSLATRADSIHMCGFDLAVAS